MKRIGDLLNYGGLLLGTFDPFTEDDSPETLLYFDELVRRVEASDAAASLPPATNAMTQMDFPDAWRIHAGRVYMFNGDTGPGSGIELHATWHKERGVWNVGAADLERVPLERGEVLVLHSLER